MLSSLYIPCYLKIAIKYLNKILVCLLSVAKAFITQSVNITSVVLKVCKMNLNKSEREMEIAEASNAACSFLCFLLPKKLKERYRMAYKCFVWFHFGQLFLLPISNLVLLPALL
jgi:hypothetical protein